MRRAVVWLVLTVGCAHRLDWPPMQLDQALVDGRAAYLAQPVSAAPRPVNVIVMMADDLGLGDVSTYGATTASTPQIDRLADEGVAFEAGYVTSPLCSPSRAGLLTGRYQQRFGHEGQPHDRYAANAFEYWAFDTFIANGHDFVLQRYARPRDEDREHQGLPVTEVTLADVLRQNGYATGTFGKWHLGWTAEHVPNSRGFDEQYGFYEAYSLYMPREKMPGIVEQHHDDFTERFIWGRGRQNTAAVRRNGVEIDEPGYLTDRIADEAIAFIEKHRERPFFAYVPFQAPHTPFQAKAELVERFKNEPDVNRRVYLALIASLDEAVGRVLDALERLKLSDNTIVVFLSDNGGAMYTHAANNAQFRAGKMTLFEGGIRVPFAMKWPGHIPAKLKYAEPVSSLDLFATVVAATGARVPTDRAYDGVDLVPFLRGESAGVPHEALFWRAEYISAVRAGPYKLVRDTNSKHTALFDLAADPGEKRDLARLLPEVRSALEARLAEWEKQCREPLWPHVMEYRYVGSDGQAFFFPL